MFKKILIVLLLCTSLVSSEEITIQEGNPDRSFLAKIVVEAKKVINGAQEIVVSAASAVENAVGNFVDEAGKIIKGTGNIVIKAGDALKGDAKESISVINGKPNEPVVKIEVITSKPNETNIEISVNDIPKSVIIVTESTKTKSSTPAVTEEPDEMITDVHTERSDLVNTTFSDNTVTPSSADGNKNTQWTNEWKHGDDC